jgi:ATP-dependent DNA ligase
MQSVKAQGFEGVVAKRRNSVYEPGLRTGAWMEDAHQSRSNS